MPKYTFLQKVGGKYMPRKKENLPHVSSQETEEKKTRKKSKVKVPPHQTSEPETDKVDLKDLDATAKHAQKKSIASRKKKQVKTVASLESSLTSKSKSTTELTPEAVPPETTKPKRKRRTKAEMEAARKELEKKMVEMTLEKETEEPMKKMRRRKKEDVTEDVKKEAKRKDTKKKANQKEMNKESMRNEEQNKVVPTEAQTKKEKQTKEAQNKETQTNGAQTASNPAKKPKKSRKKELIYAVCLKNGGEMVVEEAGEKTRKKYEGAMYELMISDTLAVLKKSEVPSARIKPMEEDMYYEINDDLYHVEFYRNGRRIG